MRRTVFLTMGVLELIVAVVLIYLGCQVPSEDDVVHSFSKVENVTRRAGRQVRLFRNQIKLLRRPALKELAARMKDQTRMVTVLLKKQALDFRTVKTLRDALSKMGDGLDGLSRTLNPSGLDKLGEALEESASFIDDKLVTATGRMADRLDKSSKVLRADARKIGELLEGLPTNLDAVRQVHDCLEKFSKGLGKMSALLSTGRLGKMRDGFAGLEDALSVGADQVDRLSSYTYPVLTFDGWRPEIERRKFWPRGARIGKGMKKAASGVRVAGKELQDFARDMPEFRKAVEASRKLVDKSRAVLAAALAQRSEVEPLLKDMPKNAQRLAEQLPQVGEDMARVLRDTGRLKDIAASLRKARKGLNGVVKGWPQVCSVLASSGKLLRAMRAQFDDALLHQGEYQKTISQTSAVADAFALMLPLLTDQFLGQLADEEKSLQDLERSVDEVSNIIPAYSQLSTRFLQIGRFLAWLVAAIVALHGTYLTLSVRMGRRFSM